MQIILNTILLILLLVGMTALSISVINTFEDLNQNKVLLPAPQTITMYQGERCAVYQSDWRGAPLYTLVCESGASYVSRDWTYLVGRPSP